MSLGAPDVSRRISISQFGLLFAASAAVTACIGAPEGGTWQGTIDTLENGTIVVENPKTGIWADGGEWQVVEELRIGSVEGDGPDMFGATTDFTVDADGRSYVFDGQAQELRVFDHNGGHVRTVGRKGGGPGEFNQVIGMDWAPDGTLWLVDPGNNRISVLDTAGNFVTGHSTPGGFVMMPWPGGFDDQGRFYNVALDPEADRFGALLVRFDEQLEPADTIQFPKFPGEGSVFEHNTGSGFMQASIPFMPFLTGYFVRRTNFYWFALTGEYQIYQRTLDGDTVRMIKKTFDPLPVTEEDVDSAVAQLEWFTRQGGKIDRARFPAVKPSMRNFVVDDEGNIWVFPYVVPLEDFGRVAEVFDPQGRFLGTARLPFVVPNRHPRPVFRRGAMYAVLLDELDVPYIVRARIIKPEAAP